MRKLIFGSAVLGLLILSAVNARTSDASTISHDSVDLRDLAQFARQVFPEARVILKSMTDSPELYFPEGISLVESALGKVHGVEFTNPGVDEVAPVRNFSLIALVHSEADGNFFRRMDVKLSRKMRQVAEVTVLSDTPLSDFRPSLTASLVERKVVVEDRVLGIRKVYPLGVGGFDQGILAPSRGTHLLTPTFRHATLQRQFLEPMRTEPEYYRGKPFIRIANARGLGTNYAFHIIQHPRMIRGFDSHGCMRLREKDLMELMLIVMEGASEAVPVDVFLKTDGTEEHPYPMHDDSFEKVQNCTTTPDAPAISCKDRHGLWKMNTELGQPPLDQIQELNPDAMNLWDLEKMLGRSDDPQALL